jgi:hypothetical protein
MALLNIFKYLLLFKYDHNLYIFEFVLCYDDFCFLFHASDEISEKLKAQINDNI